MKVGDWIIFEYGIVQIKEVENGRVTDVSDGSFSTSGRDLSDRCYPLTLSNKNAADYVESYSARVHREGGPGLNYPDLHGKAVQLAHGIMSLPESDIEGRKKAYEAVSNFYRTLFDTLRDSKRLSVEGVSLFR